MEDLVKCLGPPTWVTPAKYISDDELKYESLLLEMEDPFMIYEADYTEEEKNDDLIKRSELCRNMGKINCKEKQFIQAINKFIKAYNIRLRLPMTEKNKDEISILLSNIAICFSKVDAHFDSLRYGADATKYNPFNLKGYFHVAKSFYFLYDHKMAHMVAEDGLRFVKNKDEMKPFLSLLRKISLNRIIYSFPKEKLIERVQMFKMLDSYECKLEQTEASQQESLYIRIIHSLPRDFFNKMLEKKVVEDIFQAFKAANKMLNYFVNIRIYNMAKSTITDMLYLYTCLKINKSTDDLKKEMFELLYWGAHSYLKLEEYDLSLKFCEVAKRFRSFDRGIQFIESQILLQKKQYHEALKTLKLCKKYKFREVASEIIYEEIKFEIVFEINENNMANIFFNFPLNINASANYNKTISNSNKQEFEFHYRPEKKNTLREAVKKVCNLEASSKIKTPENNKSSTATTSMSKSKKNKKGVVNDVINNNLNVGKLNIDHKETKGTFIKCKLCKTKVEDTKWHFHESGKQHQRKLKFSAQLKLEALKYKNAKEEKNNESYEEFHSADESFDINSKTEDEEDLDNSVISDENFIELLNGGFNAQVTCDDSENDFKTKHKKEKKRRGTKKNLETENKEILYKISDNKINEDIEQQNEPFSEQITHENFGNNLVTEDVLENLENNFETKDKDKKKKRKVNKNMYELNKRLNEIQAEECDKIISIKNLPPDNTNDTFIHLDPSEYFPLPKSNYDIRLCCYTIQQNYLHNCKEEVLQVKLKINVTWIIIRERPHIQIYGFYKLCNRYPNCPHRDKCSFAHSNEEQVIWDSIKKGKFSYENFVEKHKSIHIMKETLLKKITMQYKGDLMYACKSCFEMKKMLVGKRTLDEKCANNEENHSWNANKILIHHHETNNSITTIYDLPPNYVLEICSQQRFCSKKSSCYRPHSNFEYDVWKYITSKRLTLDQFYNQYNQYVIKKETNDSKSLKPPYNVKIICKICWSQNKVASFDTDKNAKCSFQHNKLNNLIYFMTCVKKELRPLPKRCPANNILQICWSIQRGKCMYENCQFAHCVEEKDMWQWMIERNVKDLEEVAKLCSPTKAINKTAVIKPPATRFAWNIPMPASPAAPIPQKEQFYCFYCEKTFSGKKQQEEHNNSQKHLDNIRKDDEVQWNFRTPPLISIFRLCEKNENQTCLYSGVPMEYNYCTSAHGQNELEEWVVRQKWKNKKWRKAEEEHLTSMANELKQEIKAAQNIFDVVVDERSDVLIHESAKTNTTVSDKSQKLYWTFNIKTSKEQLKRVYLLEEYGWRNFSLLRDKQSNEERQIFDGELLHSINNGYSFVVKFESGMYGCFDQSIVFELESRPVVMRTINVNVGSSQSLQQLSAVKNKLSFQRWTDKNCTIVRDPMIRDALYLDLMREYPCNISDKLLENYLLIKSLNAKNYKTTMHNFLYLEEMAQIKIISKYNMVTSIKISNKIEDQFGGWQFTFPGELFGIMELPSNVQEDSLLSTSVTHILIGPVENCYNRVYEASLPKLDIHLRGINKDTVYVLINNKCCQELKLADGSILEAEVQFELDRSTFCRMHLAVDEIKFLEFLFPDINMLQKPRLINESNFKIERLNDRQNKILSYIQQGGSPFLPPLVVYGPFGTGKTETIATAVIYLTAHNERIKILICTRSNLTADEYITRFFSKYILEYPEATSILRVYNTERRIATVSKDVRKYCLVDDEKQGFKAPTENDIKNHKIIISTLETSLALKDFKSIQFSHIFIDEAGQDLELRTIMPFCLASKKTVIVIAGDHKQMVEEVYSEEAKGNNLHISLLERLYHYYTNTKLTHLPMVFLNENYRNHPEILSFISQVFYGGKDILKSKQKQKLADNKKPLEFFVTTGDEMQDENSSSFYNLSEIDEIVDKVFSLFNEWPNEWGERDASQILVTSPYSDQINRIRMALRNRSRDLMKVTVIRVQNVPGLEFQAVFLSPVRKITFSDLDKMILIKEEQGFLSNPKMLNSAFTRAKSYIGVVGDPVTLCSIGNCAKIWVEYIIKCQEYNSIHPFDYNLELIKSLHAIIKKNMDYSEKFVDDRLEFIVDEDLWEGGFEMDSDEIIKQLAEETYERKNMKSVFLQPKQIHFQSKNDQIYIDVDDCNDYNDASYQDDVQVHQIYNADQLNNLVEKNPKKYMICRLHINSSSNIYATPLQKTIDNISKIHIATRRHCGKAFDLDEVVVQILPLDRNKTSLKGKCKIYGEVVGILKHQMNLKNKVFVCYIDENNPGSMVPINSGVPKISIIQSGSHYNDKSINIYKFEKNKTVFHRNDKIDPSDPQSKLYAVRFLKWEDRFNTPLGVVVGVLKPGITVEDSLKILRLEYNIPQPLKIKTILKSKTDIEGDSNRTNHQDILIFTIDGETTKDIDDAIGFENLNDGNIKLSIHISDVSFYVQEGDPNDVEARKRGTSFYPAIGGTIHMLPENLSTEELSLLPGKIRRALSIFMVVGVDGTILENSIEIRKTWIKSKHRLTYSEVELMLDHVYHSTLPDELIHAIECIYDITNIWRWSRLGSDAYLIDDDIFSQDGPRARKLIEELMIKSNTIIAQFLVANKPNETPLRIQIAPNDQELVEWKETHQNILPFMVGVNRFLNPEQEVCTCESICECNNGFDPITEISVPNYLIEQISSCLSDRDQTQLQKLIFNVKCYPQMLLAIYKLYLIQDRSEYICSGDIPVSHRGHYSLNVSTYTHFTSPIRRYMDIVIHRMVHAILNEKSSYNQSDIRNICADCNDAMDRAKKYERNTLNTLLCDFLTKKPICIDSVILDLDESNLSCHPMQLSPFIHTNLKIKSSFMNVNEQPKLDESSQLIFKWSQRIFDRNQPPDNVQDSLNETELNSKKQITSIGGSYWRDILSIVKGNDLAWNPLHISVFQTNEINEMEPTCEGEVLRRLQKFCKFGLNLERSDLLKLQLGATIKKGLMQPVVQYFPCTQLNGICLEHQENPIKCFSQRAHKQASKSNYSNIEDYKQSWMPVLLMESVMSAVNSGISAIIHNVPIQWKELLTDNTVKYVGYFFLRSNFCMERDINLLWSDEKLDDDDDDVPEVDVQTYICLRYNNLSYNIPQSNLPFGNDLFESDVVTWVAHCVVRKIEHTDNNNYKVTLVINQQSCQFPRKLLDPAESCRATIEWITMPKPMKNMLEALETIYLSSDLVKNIAIGSINHMEAVCCNNSLNIDYGRNLNPLNNVQMIALNKTKTSPFQLIQGPPGTGKTLVAAYIAYTFFKINEFDVETNSMKAQVMCCGPSNKSVDVIASYLTKFSNPRLQILRVYGRKQELEDYPNPYFEPLVKKKFKLTDSSIDESVRRISLHHIIRDISKCEYANTILEFEERFRQMHSKEVFRSDNFETIAKEYKEAIRNAEKIFLRHADIILMTCSSSLSRRSEHFKIKQLVIDECGMSMEPESLVPMVANKPEQIILLGDHQQLKPIVTEKQACKLGLETSLFERYHEQAFMLTKQYRMQRSIAEFPSEQFYLNRLVVGNPDQNYPSALNFWPGGPHHPIAFVHIVGEEKSLNASTEEGGQQSKSNELEIEWAIQIAFKLVHTYKIKQTEIAILSQYRAQCTFLSKGLAMKNLSQVTVQTVVSAQGSEWKYVILSTVRSMPLFEIEDAPSNQWKRKNLGFITDYHQINVALTRAQKGLIILGNKVLLRTDDMWYALIEHYQQKNALIDGSDFILRMR